jgi:hypothetical protein
LISQIPQIDPQACGSELKRTFFWGRKGNETFLTSKHFHIPYNDLQYTAPGPFRATSGPLQTSCGHHAGMETPEAQPDDH